jgi:hypothetical protein
MCSAIVLATSSRWHALGDIIALCASVRPVPGPVAVGTALSGRPPHRTRRADFPDRAPTSALGQSRVHRSCVLFVLKTHHEVVGVTHDVHLTARACFFLHDLAHRSST